MKSLIDYVINFYNEREAFISVTPISKDQSEEFLEIFLFCTYSFRQSYNLDLKHPVCVSLGKSLLQVDDARDPLMLTLANPNIKLNTKNPLIEMSTKDVKITKPLLKRADKGFTGKLQAEGQMIQFIMDPQGFNFLGEGLNYYVPLSVGLLLNHLAYRPHSKNWVVGLSAVAKACGQTILNQSITAPTQMTLALEITQSAF